MRLVSISMLLLTTAGMTGYSGCAADVEASNVLMTTQAAATTSLQGVQYALLCETEQDDGSLVPLSRTSFVPFHAGSAPSWLNEAGTGPDHQFADWFSIIPAPATCSVTATGGSIEGSTEAFVAEDACAVAHASFSVVENETEELVMVLQCEGDPSGAGDLVTVVNWNPWIERLVIDKFMCVSDSTTITAFVSDPEGDSVTCTWEISSVPAGAEEAASVVPAATGSEAGHEVVFTANAPGPYEVHLVCVDAMDGEVNLSFPMHVMECNDDTDTGSDDTDTGNDDTDTGNEDTDSGSDSETETVGDCTELTAIDLGAEHVATTVPTSGCVKISSYPPWWVIRVSVVQSQGGGTAYPVPIEWSNCGTHGVDQIDMDWDQVMLAPIDTSCPVIIDLRGNPLGVITLRWWGNG